MKKIIAVIILLMAAQAAQAYSALDPTRQIPNGRILALGKAYIGLAEGTGAIFTNPAGLADAAGWQFTSMSGKFLDEYSYLSVAGIYPTTAGVIGFGFAGTSIAGAFATTIEAGSDPADPIYTIDTTQPEMGNRSNAFVMSYGNQMKNIPYLQKFPLAENLSLGTNLKLFSASMYGDSISGGDASGYDMDLGLKYFPPQKWMTFGVTLQNLLPVSLGGKLRYSSGHEEAYPAILAIGSAYKLLGRKNAWQTLGDNELTLLVDTDKYPSISNYPFVWHAALEWKPLPIIALRFGIDQDAVGDGKGGLQVVSDNAFGVGLGYGGFSFDYAYHTFAGAPNIDNHYFSLTYGIEVPTTVGKKPIRVDVPADRLITFEASTSVSGRVVDQSIKALTINGIPLNLSLQGDFSTLYDLKLGKNAILLNAEKVRVLRLMAFPDVAASYWVAQPISLLSMSKIITGYPDGTFRPAGNITRAEMCTLLMKTMPAETGTAETAAFRDVAAGHWAGRYIARAASRGVVKGYPDGSFRPDGKITRAEGLAMIARFDGIAEEVYANQFPDVNDKLWAARIIAGAQRRGILKYLAMKPFEPARLLTRAETVEMLSRTDAVGVLLESDLLNWESY